MKIGVISDTHDGLANTARAVQVFSREKVSCILHAGDIGSADTAQMFAGIGNVRFIAVFGNCDTARAELAEAISSFGGEIHEVYDGQIDGRRIFMSHRPNVRMMEDALADSKFDLIIYGHTHRLDIRKVGRTLVVNPGTTRCWQMGHPHVVIVELDTLTAEAAALI